MSQSDAFQAKPASDLFPREQLCRDLMMMGISETHAGPVVDLAIIAALTARQAMLDALEKHTDGRISLTAFGPLIDLTTHVMSQLRIDLIAAAAASGHPIKMMV